ncbi:MAG: DNA adenine methylase [Bacteroidales bacterium]|nr:DNA adenine methylase [Bacteroidales bacterium]
MLGQMNLFDIEVVPTFPSTRYQGSKLKYVDWIWECVKDLSFDTVLDAFGGTGCIAYKMKSEGKCVTYNDILTFNSMIGRALVENDSVRVSDDVLDYVLTRHSDIQYPTFITDTFSDIYYTDEENQWLDLVVTNIRSVKNKYEQAILYFALFQACIIKRPYNLFHRKNLYIRLQDVERSFGNKVTWDTPFEEHFKTFVTEANNAVFSNGNRNKSINKDAAAISNHFDFVYIDTPYVSSDGIGVNYADFYHFLEGLIDYECWHEKIDYTSKHRRLKIVPSEWTNPKTVTTAFERLIHNFKNSILAISYRSDGIPSVDVIVDMLEREGKNVKVHESRKIKYVLSNKISSEILIIAT